MPPFHTVKVFEMTLPSRVMLAGLLDIDGPWLDAARAGTRAPPNASAVKKQPKMPIGDFVLLTFLHEHCRAMR